jgi:hypothetical protein
LPSPPACGRRGRGPRGTREVGVPCGSALSPTSPRPSPPPKGGEGAYRAVGAPQICECRSHRGRERDRNHCWRCARDQGPARSCGRWSWPIPEPLALPMVGCRRRLSAHSRPTKKLPNSQRILQFAAAVNWERAACSDAALSTLLLPCYRFWRSCYRLFAPLFAPLRSAVTEWRRTLISFVFGAILHPTPGRPEEFSPVIRAKTGEKRIAPPGGATGISGPLPRLQ